MNTSLEFIRIAVNVKVVKSSQIRQRDRTARETVKIPSESSLKRLGRGETMGPFNACIVKSYVQTIETNNQNNHNGLKTCSSPSAPPQRTKDSDEQ